MSRPEPVIRFAFQHRTKYVVRNLNFSSQDSRKRHLEMSGKIILAQLVAK